jgi:hypothetical protein
MEKYIAAIIIIVIAIIAAYTISEGITGAVIGGAVNQTKVLDNNINNTINITNASQQSEPIISPAFNKTTSSIPQGTAQNQTNQTNRTIIPSGGGGGGGSSSSSSCSNECSSGQRCNGNYLEYCGNYDSDPCLEWGNSSYCSCGCSNNSCNTCPSNFSTNISVSPTTVIINRSNTENFSISIDINTNAYVYAGEFKLYFNPTIVNVSIVSEGDFLKSDNATTYPVISINNTEGWISFADTRIGVQSGVTGSGTLANITFYVKSTGASLLDLINVTLSDISLNPVSGIAITDGNVTII